MQFVVAVHGTRGDVEPCVAVGLELLRRGHEVRMAVPPNLLGFIDSVGFTGVAYGPDSQAQLDEEIVRNLWSVRNPARLLRAGAEYITRDWAKMSATLASLADGADLILTGQLYQGVAVNVAECYDIPLVAVHQFPHRVNGQLVPFLPSPVIRATMTALEWLYWGMTKKAEEMQRRELGLPQTSVSSRRRMAEYGALEIQAYDELFFPGLAVEWDDRRPFVGALSLQLPTDNDEEVASWIAAGTPPIYFGFGSTPVHSPDDTIALIAAACAELNERALIYCPVSDFNRLPPHVKLVGPVNYATVLPSCRAVVHHGGAGTTAAGLRAGLPTLILWELADQPLWAVQVKRLKVGSARRFSRITVKSLTRELRSILAPQYISRAREIATRMSKPAAAVKRAADLLEDEARRGV